MRCRRPTSVRTLLITTFLLLLIMMIILEQPGPLFVQTRLKIFGNEIGCYRNHYMKTLPHIGDNVPDNSIFFHETSCGSQMAGRIMVTGRQACAVESAALLHPHRQVYLLFTSPGDLKRGTGDASDLALKALQGYDNVQLQHVDFANYLNNSPLAYLYASGSIELSIYAGSHASDVLRYMTLWKFGGTYLDLDVVVMKPLDDLGENYAGAESNENVAAGVMGLSSRGIGHQWASQCLEDLSQTFSGRDWGNNGPGVITRLLRRLCGVQHAMDMSEDSCKGFRVMPPNVFYPIPWWNWTMYFRTSDTQKTLSLVKDSYAIHVWNKHSKNALLVGDSAYAKVARQFCPRVYAALSEGCF